MATVAPLPPVAAVSEDFLDLKVRLHQSLLDEINLSVIERMPKEQFVSEVGDIIRELLTNETTPLNERERKQIVKDVLDEVMGLGPLEPLLHDDSIDDILVNTFDKVYVERNGRLELTPVRFQDNTHLLRIINKMVAAVGRRVDEGSPVVDARLADGSRINAVLPPVAVDGPLLSIRKFASRPFDLELLIENGTITGDMAVMLQGMVRGKISILISGGTGSGKTTMLNALSKAIDARERIVTIEDAAELQLQQPHVARLETRRQRRSHATRPRQKCTAHASRPDHPGRGARRRSLRHAASHEHRSRRIDVDHPRQFAKGRDHPTGTGDRHGRSRYVATHHSVADRFGHSGGHAAGSRNRRQAPPHQYAGNGGHGGRCADHERNSAICPHRHRLRRQYSRPLRLEGHSPEIYRAT
jgi:hypothetical protein